MNLCEPLASPLYDLPDCDRFAPKATVASHAPEAEVDPETVQVYRTGKNGLGESASQLRIRRAVNGRAALVGGSSIAGSGRPLRTSDIGH